jgi:hypothetical protein
MRRTGRAAQVGTVMSRFPAWLLPLGLVLLQLATWPGAPLLQHEPLPRSRRHVLIALAALAVRADRHSGRRRRLPAEALAFAARTGRETFDALTRLVAILRLPGSGPRLLDLIDGFRELGQQVTVEITPGPLSEPVVAAACGIVREALTNTCGTHRERPSKCG